MGALRLGYFPGVIGFVILIKPETLHEIRKRGPRDPEAVNHDPAKLSMHRAAAPTTSMRSASDKRMQTGQTGMPRTWRRKQAGRSCRSNRADRLARLTSNLRGCSSELRAGF